MFERTYQCTRWLLVGPNLFGSLRNQCRFHRFDRAQIRSRLIKYSTPRGAQPSGPLTLRRIDSVPLRPPKDLWKALGFTAVVGGVTFTFAIISDFERSKRRIRRYWNDAMEMFGSVQRKYQFYESSFSDGQKSSLIIIALNAVVFAMWKLKALEPLMWRWFTNSFCSKSLCFPMVLSAFSHSNWLHLGVNMYVLYSFAGVSIDRFLGMSQFAAFYITAAVISSFTSLVHKCVVRSPSRALGASGAILAVLAYTCVMIPDARLQIIFLPVFDFSAQTAVISLLLFDLLGLLLRFRLFDHSAHLGGTLFGIFYGLYGERIIWREYGNKVIKFYRKITGPG
ncbi:hypothetical protein AB6A40_010056 [Gnathostoma spinigerum]|uniref:rhomboid protease n=1 Tax=Gnathostoma spinigerum TaxID=75299 RepID=A0ABD6F205_9BILA